MDENALFFAWAKRFDRYIEASAGRLVLFHLENFSLHASVIPDLNCDRIEFLPRKKAPELERMDARIICFLKNAYRRSQYSREVDILFDSNTDIYMILISLRQ